MSPSSEMRSWRNNRDDKSDETPIVVAISLVLEHESSETALHHVETKDVSSKGDVGSELYLISAQVMEHSPR